MSDESLATGQHYKKSKVNQTDVGQPIDPAWIAEKYPDLTPMRFTVLKKILRCGTGDKSYEQDLHDCIGALERELQLYSFKHKPTKITGADLEAQFIANEQGQANAVVSCVKELIEVNNKKHGLIPRVE